MPFCILISFGCFYQWHSSKYPNMQFPETGSFPQLHLCPYMAKPYSFSWYSLYLTHTTCGMESINVDKNYA